MDIQLPLSLTLTLSAVAGALPFLIAGAVIEARHYRRLARIPAEIAAVRLLSGCASPPTAPGTGPRALGMVSADVVLCPPPLGRLLVIIRRLIGGPIPLFERLSDRARREALYRIRCQAVALGADTVAGIRFTAVTMGTGRICVAAYGTALRGASAGPDGALAPLLTEAAASPPAPRKRTFAILVLGGAVPVLLGGLGSALFEVFAEAYPAIKRLSTRWFRF